ncbi:molybdopterin oxidoreductase family protein, partial [Vibrio parahaemolyticus V-223/04]
TLR